MENSKKVNERLLNLLNLTEKDEIAQELFNLLDDYKSNIVMSIQKQYFLRDFETNEYIASDWFISTPINGEFYLTNNAIYEVIQVTHSFGNEAGTIQVKMQRELKSK
ncbi:MAG TPA: hypothetical protein DCQ68_01845 [Chryseobacterium indologenes]|nr:hypothetical protein [Chryseobacterium indologenes]